VRTPTQVEETEEPLPTLTPEALVQEALDNRPEVRQLRASLRAAEASVKIARTNQLPSLNAGTSVGVSGSEFPGDSHDWSYGLSLSWDLYDSGLTKGLIAESEANLVSAQASLKQTELSIGSAVVKAYLDVQSAGQQVVTAETGVKSAEEALRVAAGRYEAGVAPYLEVTDAETALITAQTSQVNAKYGLSLARAALLYALGREDQ
jgi:outer membrane protein